MRGGCGRGYCRTQLRYLMSSSRHDIMREEIPHCALMRRSGGCHFGHFGGGHGDPPPATQCWMLGWGGSRTPIKYYGGFPPSVGFVLNKEYPLAPCRPRLPLSHAQFPRTGTWAARGAFAARPKSYKCKRGFYICNQNVYRCKYGILVGVSWGR